MLFEPFKIGDMELKNRLVLAPMSLNLSKDGYVTQAPERKKVVIAGGGPGFRLSPE